MPRSTTTSPKALPRDQSTTGAENGISDEELLEMVRPVPLDPTDYSGDKQVTEGLRRRLLKREQKTK